MRLDRWSYLGFAALAAVLGSACGEGIGGAQPPEIFVDPERVVFAKLAIGQSADKVVEIRNEGAGRLIIDAIGLELQGSADYQLFFADTPDGQQRLGIDKAGTNTFPKPWTIDGASSKYIIVNYSPADDSFDPAAIRLSSNDSDERIVSVPISPAGGAAEIQVNPTSLDFERVSAGEDKTLDVTVQNIGQLNLDILKIGLNGSQEFLPLINGQDPRRNEMVLSDPDGDGQPGLAPDQSFTITVIYNPQTEGPDEAQLSILSSDMSRPDVRVNLRANGATPCLKVVPGALEFPASLVNRTDSRLLTLFSCGGGQLEISQIELAPDGDPSFGIDTESLDLAFPDFPTIMPPQVGAAQASRAFHIEFSPREERVYNSKLLVHTNDPIEPIKTISLLGRGVLNACPQARATPEEHFVQPLDTVVFDGSASVDPDGPNNRPATYEWVITDRPVGSVSAVGESFLNPADPAGGISPDNPSTPIAVFWVDLAGTYTAELRVRDNLGLSSQDCETSATVTIIAKPDEAIHIQLVWSTPNDPDETDREGTDVDLHLLHPLADNWFTEPYDCYFGNPNPDWGTLEDPSDDPIIDIDDISGGGPENANLATPESTEVLGGPYRVGIHYYSSRELVNGTDFGESIAKVRIFLNGELTWDYTGMDPNSGDVEGGEFPLAAQDAFCQVATIHWPAALVESAVQCFDTRP